MCGICGILDADGDPIERARRVETMSAAMAHRGPDDSGSWSDETLSLGFRRLAVIDLATGNQPIRLEDDRAVIVLNGEVYNFRELRRDLEGRQRFATRGDVEVVLRLYAEEGIAALRRIQGMFALALWDRKRRTLFLARDRFGIKPLFVSEERGSLAFASELGALVAAGIPRAPSPDLLEIRHVLDQRYPSPGGTGLTGVRSLPPATVLEITPSSRREFAYWEPPAPRPAPRDRREAREELTTRLRRAVTRQLVADVPLGVFLSGGLDSSVVAALARETAGRGLETFSVGFEGEGSVSELPWASRVARRLGTVHHEILMDPRRVAADLPEILSRLDGPLGDATAIPTWYLSRLARSRVTVALSGEGADELFGGYPRQRYDVLIDRAGAARSVVPALLRLAGRRASTRLRRRLGMSPGLGRQLDWSRVFEPAAIASLTSSPLPEQDALTALRAGEANRWREIASIDPVNARLEADRVFYLPGDLLPKVDRMSMAHSLEVRVPYLDEEVAEFALALPGELKIGLRAGKLLLREAAADLLPRDVIRRPKQGFDVPLSSWIRGPLRATVEDLLSREALRRHGLFRPDAIQSLLAEHLSRRADHGERLWCLLAIEGWLRAILDRPAGVGR